MKSEDYFEAGKNVTLLGLIGCVLLAIVKLLTGILGKSNALLADALHSVSDVAATIVVLVGLKISDKPADEHHPYGHGKAESLSAVLVGVILILAGGYIAFSCLHVLAHGHLPSPGKIALWVAVISIVAKEIMYRYTRRVGERIHSPAVIANAYDHRTDAYSSIPVFFGILGARFGYPYLDPIAGLLVVIFIFKMGLDILHKNVDILMDSEIQKSLFGEIRQAALRIDGVREVHDLRARQSGPKILVDIEINVDKNITVREGHEIALNVKRELESIEQVDHVLVHVNPHLAASEVTKR